MLEPGDISHRRICWPNPDATCLEGGCIWCNDEKFRPLYEIWQYAQQAGEVPNRCGGESQLATKAYKHGRDNDFFNADVRRRKGEQT